MLERSLTPRVISPYSVLGVDPGAPREKLDATYAHLVHVLDEENFMNTPQSWVQAQQAYMAVENAYKRITAGEPDESNEDPEEACILPKLGQLLVAEGLITLEQLNDAIRQQKSGPGDVPLGELLKESSLISQAELDKFLLNQRLIKLPADSPYQLGQRLIGLGIITEDMLRIALVEQRNSGKQLGEVLVERNWLAEDILYALLDESRGDACIAD
jgi:hypothetical protein